MKQTKKKAAALPETIQKSSREEVVSRSERRPSFIRLDAIGELIKQTREKNKLTQSQLAEILEMDKTYVSKMENNLKIQRLDTIIKVIHALNGQLIIRLPAETGMTDTELV